jgi:sigma-B regulation protein RsbU (phosphoserine phosphatase)
MSTQPLKHSKSKKHDYTKYMKLIDIYQLLISYNRIESQLNAAINILKENIPCKIKLWLADSLLKPTEIKKFRKNTIIVSDLLPDMEKAFSEKRIITNPILDEKANVFPIIAACPILIEDRVQTIIEIEKEDEGEFSGEEIRFLVDLFVLLSVCLSQLKQKLKLIAFEEENEHLISIAKVNQSILSNLDRDSLVNSAISLLYQQYNFTRVNIYIAQDGGNESYLLTGITKNGIEIQKLQVGLNELELLSECVADRELIVINDVHKEKRFPQYFLDNNIQSALLLPLSHGEKLIGVLELCSDQKNYFTQARLDQYKLVANTITIALRNSYLFESAFLNRKIAEKLQETIGALCVDITFDDVLAHFLEEINNFIEYNASAIWLVDNSSDNSSTDLSIASYHLVAINISGGNSKEKEVFRSKDSNDFPEEISVNLDKANDLFVVNSWVSDVIKSRSISIRQPNTPLEPLGAILGFNPDHSAIGIPLTIGNQVTGCLILVHHLAGQYDQKTEEKASIIANYGSVALENARLYSVAHDQAWISTVLLQVAEATQSITNMDELLETTVEILPGLFGVEACAIFLWDPSTETFVNSRAYGFEDDQSNRLNEWDISSSEGHLFETIRDSKIPIVLNSDAITEQISAEIFEGYDLEKDLLIIFPLSTQISFCGALLVDFTNSSLDVNSSQETWDEKYALIQGAANQVAISIENLHLIKSQEEEAYISVALLQVAQAIVSLNQLDEILGTIVRITPILVGVKRCIIYLWDENELEFHQSQYFGFAKSDLELMGQVVKKKEFPFIDAIHNGNRIVYHLLGTENTPLSWYEISLEECFTFYDNDSDEETSSEAKKVNQIKIDLKPLNTRERLLIGFPISIKGENLGVMVIEEEDHIKGSPSQHVREKRIEIVKGITQQAAIAIKNELLQKEAVKSEVMERELQLAREIQTAFLPKKIPQIHGWDFAVRWQPARQVGGDFYDILILDDDRIGFVIADVADKGMPAALFMTLIRTLIRAAANDKQSPSFVLRQVNDLLIPDTKNGMFVTVFYGVLSLSTGKFIYANGGHNPPILRHIQDEELIELTRTGMALGIFSDIEIDEREVTLNCGDWLMMYTDGVTEAFSIDEEMFGKDRLFQILLNHEFVDPESILDAIESEVNLFINGADLSDDMTLTAIIRKCP